MAKKYQDKGFSFLFVYSREAHPGENFPAHRSMEDKLHHAQAFKEKEGVERPVLVDDLEGTGHHLYGTLPNMTYLISTSGQILFRADWTDPPTIEGALDYILASRARRREGLHLAPFYSEFVGYRWSDPAKAREVMGAAGQQALNDMADTMKRWSAHKGPRPGRIELT